MKAFRTLATIVVMSIILLAITSYGAYGALQKFYAQGVAPYVDGDPGLRDRAMADFKEQVLLQALMEILGPDSVKANEEIIKRGILAKPDKFIKAYRIVSETVTGGLFRINGEAEISRQTLEEELAALGLLGTSTSVHRQDEYEKGELRSILWKEQSSCGEYGQEFSKILKESLAARGWLITPEGQEGAREPDQFRWVITAVIACSEGTDASSISGTVEVKNGTTNSVEAVISEKVEKEPESPMLEGVILLADVIKPQLLRIIESNGAVTDLTAPSRTGTTEISPLTDSTWEITIPDHPCLVKWEQLEKALSDMNLKFRLSKMVIGAKDCKIQVEGLPSSFTEYLQEIENDGKIALKIQYLNPSARMVTLRISANRQPGFPEGNQ